MTGARARPAEPTSSLSYAIAGIPCVVTASADVLAQVDATYGAFRADLPSDVDVLALEPAEDEALVGLFNRLVEGVVERLARRGIYAIHGASLVYRDRALIVSGPSGAGKTTLALGLLRHGLRLLSDEFALSARDGRTVLPYRRALHIRPGTPELIGELAFLEQRQPQTLGGGIEWAVLPGELARVFPGCLGDAAPLRHVVLLDPRAENAGLLEPLSPALAAVELLRATPAAAGDFVGAVQRVTRLLDGARCARLRPGPLAGSLELLLDWLGVDDA